METIGNIHVGRPQIAPDAPAHTRGVREGNQPPAIARDPGIRRSGRFIAAATVRRSTGVNARAHQPIDPRMPILTPA
jgi:hypothetical protein